LILQETAIYDLEKLELNRVQQTQGSPESLPQVPEDPAILPHKVFKLQLAIPYCEKRHRGRLLENLGSLPEVTILTFTIGKQGKALEFTVLLVDKEASEESQCYIDASCRANGSVFAKTGKHHLAICFPRKGIRFYHDGSSSCAIEDLLKLSGLQLRSIHFKGDSPFVKDLLVNKLAVRELLLQTSIVVDQLDYKQQQIAKEIRSIYSNIVHQVRKSAERRYNGALSRNFLQLQGPEAGAFILSFGKKQQAEIAKCYRQLLLNLELNEDCIRTTRKNLEVLQEQDQAEGKYTKQFDDIYELLDCKEKELEISVDIAREALLALSVRIVHQAKEVLAKVECLLDRPGGLNRDPEEYRLGLQTAEENYLAAFAANWIELDPRLSENQTLHYIYEGGAWCTICEELLCKFRQDRVYNELQYCLYQLFCDIGALVSDLRGDQVRIIKGIFKGPIIQTPGGKDITHHRAWKSIELDKNKLTGLIVKICEEKYGPSASLPGLSPCESEWSLITKGLTHDLQFEVGLIELESCAKQATHNDQVLARFELSVWRLCTAIFDPETTPFGQEGGHTHDLIKDVISLFTTFQVTKRAVDQEYRERRIYTVTDCLALAEAAAEALLKIGDIVTSDRVTGQFFGRPVTVVINAIGQQLFGEITRANNATERLVQEYALTHGKFQQIVILQLYLHLISSNNDRATAIRESYQIARENTVDAGPLVITEDLPLLDLSDEAVADLPTLDVTTEGSAGNPYDASIEETDQFGEEQDWQPNNEFIPLAEIVPPEAQTCTVQALQETVQVQQTFEQNIVAQPALCTFATGIRQTPDDTTDGSFQNVDTRRVRRRVNGNEVQTVSEQRADSLLITVDGIISQVEASGPNQ
jgi:hypothetical protein